MNRIYNFWTFTIAIVTLIYVFIDSLDQNYHIFHKAVDFIKTNYHHQVLFVVAVLILLINLRRSIKKWSGIKIVNQKKRFLFNVAIKGNRRKVVIAKNSLEIIAFFLLFIGFTLISIDAFLISIALFICILDMIINTVLGLKFKKYRVGMTKNAIVLIDREVSAIYFKGVKKIILQDNILYFDYMNDLVLDLPLNFFSKKEQIQLIDLLQKNINKDKVYFIGFESILP